MDFFEVVHTQRSIRRFKPDAVPDEVLWTMLDAAIRAPSGSNTQPWGWLVVRDAAKRKLLGKAVRDHFSAEGRLDDLKAEVERRETPSRKLSLQRAIHLFENLHQAPVIIIPCLVSVTSPVTDRHTLLAGSSIYGAVQNLMLAARAQGIGTVLTTFNSFIEDTIRKEFHLPDTSVPTCVIPVGYPDTERFGPTTRKPAETVTFWDDWGVTADRSVT